MRKKSKEDEQTLKELNSAHRHLQAKCQLVQKPVALKELNCSCFCHITNILLTELRRSVCSCMGGSQGRIQDFEMGCEFL